jgi:hypothetical protein
VRALVLLQSYIPQPQMPRLQQKLPRKLQPPRVEFNTNTAITKVTSRMEFSTAKACTFGMTEQDTREISLKAI